MINSVNNNYRMQYVEKWKPVIEVLYEQFEVHTHIRSIFTCNIAQLCENTQRLYTNYNIDFENQVEIFSNTIIDLYCLINALEALNIDVYIASGPIIYNYNCSGIIEMSSSDYIDYDSFIIKPNLKRVYIYTLDLINHWLRYGVEYDNN